MMVTHGNVGELILTSIERTGYLTIKISCSIIIVCMYVGAVICKNQQC